ncbi:MAG: Fic family protein [Planctomycetes bacterium]|nr:Fic family protein [Planctomycetota bacterium]
MTFIHELSDWPDLNWDSAALAVPLASTRHEQGLLIGRMSALSVELRRESSLVTLTDEVVQSSAIEGEVLDRREVRSSIARRIGVAVPGAARSSRHVDGIVEMMLDAMQSVEAPLSKARLGRWHAALFPTGHSGIRPITVGTWRTTQAGPMHVVSGPIGRERVHFIAPAADRLEQEMARFIAWFNDVSTPGVNESLPRLDPFLIAGVAHFWFVTIHPYEDGNGRIARAIADLALSRADGTDDRFYSMSARIEGERETYYRELEAAQRGGLDITSWLLWFLGCIGRAIDAADQTLSKVRTRAALLQSPTAPRLNDRQRRVLARALEGLEGPLTTSKYAKLARCSQDSALRDVRDLVDRRILVENSGGGRSTSYRLAPSWERPG